MRVNNETVAHNFIYGVDSHAGNFHNETRGRVGYLYSYSSLLAVKFVAHDLIIVCNSIANYSSTSARHASYLRRAINGEKVVYIDALQFHGGYNDKKEDVSKWLNENDLSDKIDAYFNIAKKQARARKRDYSRELKIILDEMEIIVNYAKIDKRGKNYKAYKKITSGADLPALIDAAIKQEKEENKKRARAKYKKNKERLENFTGAKLNYTAHEMENFQVLRVEGEKILTSGSVSVDYDAAKILYSAFKKGKKVVGQKIDYYTILRADEKAVKIGCHNILTKELKRIFEGGVK